MSINDQCKLKPKSYQKRFTRCPKKVSEGNKVGKTKFFSSSLFSYHSEGKAKFFFKKKHGKIVDQFLKWERINNSNKLLSSKRKCFGTSFNVGSDFKDLPTNDIQSKHRPRGKLFLMRKYKSLDTDPLPSETGIMEENENVNNECVKEQ